MSEELITKKCARCGRELSINCFHKDSRSSDGYHPWCKKCREERRQEMKKINEKKLKTLGLSSYTPRELILELKKRGYTGKLSFTKVMEIDLENLD